MAGNDLSAGLKSRHVTMISIAGVIGAGLFVGSGTAITTSRTRGAARVCVRRARSSCW